MVATAPPSRFSESTAAAASSATATAMAPRPIRRRVWRDDLMGSPRPLGEAVALPLAVERGGIDAQGPRGGVEGGVAGEHRRDMAALGGRPRPRPLRLP